MEAAVSSNVLWRKEDASERSSSGGGNKVVLVNAVTTHAHRADEHSTTVERHGTREDRHAIRQIGIHCDRGREGSPIKRVDGRNRGNGDDGKALL